MATRIDILKLQEEDRFIEGDLEVRDLIITGGTLIVTGTVSVEGCVEIINGSLIVANDLRCAPNFIVIDSDVSARYIWVEQGAFIGLSNIYANVGIKTYNIYVYESEIQAPFVESDN